MTKNDEFGISSATLVSSEKQKRDGQFGGCKTLCATVIENFPVRFEKFGIQIFTISDLAQ